MFTTDTIRFPAALLAVCMFSTGCGADTQNQAAQPESGKAVPATEPVSKNGLDNPEVIVFGGLDDALAFLQGENWWGEEKRGEQLTVPHALMTGISQNWRDGANKLPVAQKKEIFYRFMLPLIMHANQMVMERRANLERAKAQLAKGQPLSADQLAELQKGAVLMRVDGAAGLAALPPDSPDLVPIIDKLLYKLDIIPAGLALGQAAYESGYGTSRFAVEGNALFGQWTYGGKGLKPEQQRKHLGDHRIAAFDWPFDSVRGYFINLDSHPAYEDFRRLRAQLRAAGEPLTSLRLADGLIKYSERGQKYVDTLKSVIRVNHLDIADDAVFRDEPIRFLVGAGSPERAAEIRQDIEKKRDSGELQEIVTSMRLE